MDAGLLTARLVFGLMLSVYGSQKLFGWFGGYGISGTGGFFESLGFRPGWFFALVAGLCETTGGLLIASGLFTPFGAALIIPVMLTAIVTVHWGKGLLAATNGVELPLHYASAAICVALTGPGAYSVDAALGLTARWTAQLTGIVLAAGLLGGLANLGIRRRPIPTAAHT